MPSNKWSLLAGLVVAALGPLSVNGATAPTGCVSFDTSWNLLAFGFNGKDYNAGAQDTWGSGVFTGLFLH